MDPLDIIENRIQQVEAMLGYNGEEGNDSVAVVDQITNVEKLLNNITSGREKLTEINKRLDELNDYLDPQYIETLNDNKGKMNYVLSNEPSIKQFAKNMELCKEKMKVLDADTLNTDIPKYNEEIRKMIAKNTEDKTECDEMEKRFQQLAESNLQKLNSISERIVVLSKAIDSSKP